MVIGLLIVTAIPTITGAAQAISAQRNRDKALKDERRMKKFHVDVHCASDDHAARNIKGGRIVLKADRLWVGPAGVTEEGNNGYVAEAFYIEYPDPEVPSSLGEARIIRY